MKKQNRIPKSEYFQQRYEQAIAKGLTDKANYYKGRLEQLKKPKIGDVTTTKLGKLERHEIKAGNNGEAIVFCSM